MKERLLLKTLGLLAAVSFACTVLLWILPGGQAHLPLQGKYAVALRLGGLFGQAIGIFALSALFAVIGYAINRKNMGVAYPGLTVGSMAAVCCARAEPRRHRQGGA